MHFANYRTIALISHMLNYKSTVDQRPKEPKKEPTWDHDKPQRHSQKLPWNKVWISLQKTVEKVISQGIAWYDIKRGESESEVVQLCPTLRPHGL